MVRDINLDKPLLLKIQTIYAKCLILIVKETVLLYLMVLKNIKEQQIDLKKKL